MVIRAFGLSFGVVVGVDLFDYSTVSSLLQLRDELDFVLVPTCSDRTEGLELVARMGSAVMPGGVAISNTYSKDKISNATMCMFGERIKPRQSRLLGDSGIISVYHVDIGAFKREKLCQQNSGSPYDWLLRPPPV